MFIASLLRIQQGNDHFDPTSVRDHFMERWSKLCAGVPVPYEAVDGSTGVIDLRASPLSGVVIDVRPLCNDAASLVYTLTYQWNRVWS